MRPAPERVLLIGSGKAAVGCVYALHRAGARFEVIETENLPSSFVESACRKHGVRHGKIFDRAAIRDELMRISADPRPLLVVSAHNRYIFPCDFLAQAHVRVVNFHNSLLPAHAGVNAPTWAIYEQDVESGITWHEVDSGVDTGDVFLQRRITISERMTALELTRQCMDAGAKAFAEILPRLLDGTARAAPQPKEWRRTLHLGRDVPNQGRLDPSWPFEKMSAFMRSLDYGPLSFFPKPQLEWRGNKYQVEGYRLSENVEGTAGGSTKTSENIETFAVPGPRFTLTLLLSRNT